MKAVFPCKGVIILRKTDIQKLEAFYQSSLSTSKMSEIYNTTEYMLQIGCLNYLPPKAKIVLNENNLLNISQLRTIMNNASQTKDTPNSNINDALSDDDILSHPFFTTLKPID